MTSLAAALLDLASPIGWLATNPGAAFALFIAATATCWTIENHGTQTR